MNDLDDGPGNRRLIGRLVASVGTQGRAVTGDLSAAKHFARRMANVRFCMLSGTLRPRPEPNFLADFSTATALGVQGTSRSSRPSRRSSLGRLRFREAIAILREEIMTWV